MVSDKGLHLGRIGDKGDMRGYMTQIPFNAANGEKAGEVQFYENGNVWVNGRILNVEQAVESQLAYIFHYGGGGFEGERAYLELDRNGEIVGSVLFRNAAHKARLIYSAHILNQFETIMANMRDGREGFPYAPCEFYKLGENSLSNDKEFPYTLRAKGSKNGEMHEYTLQELVYATRLIMVANDLGMSYIRPFFWVDGSDGLKIPTVGRKLNVGIAPLPWGTYLKPEHYKTGLKVLVAPYPRIGDDMDVTRKLSGNYLNSARNINIALKLDYGEVLVCNQEGKVVEGSAENLFVLKNGVIYSPKIDDHILPGITRDSIKYIVSDMGLPLEWKAFTLDDIKTADAIMLTGTGAELIHVKQLDVIPNLRENLDAATMLRPEDSGPRKMKPLAEPITTLINNGEKHPVVDEIQARFGRVFRQGTRENRKYGDRWLTPLFESNDERRQMLLEAKRLMKPVKAPARSNGEARKMTSQAGRVPR